VGEVVGNSVEMHVREAACAARPHDQKVGVSGGDSQGRVGIATNKQCLDRVAAAGFGQGGG
jgi:hypothetical protein